MNNLIQINVQQINQELIETVSARELHSWLEVNTRFNDWINRRIDTYEFIKDIDYVIVENLSYSNLSNHKSSSQKQFDYFITLDMAKELAMIERNEKGRIVRRYFIECEKQLRTKHPTTLQTIENTLNKLYKKQEHYQLELGKSTLGATVSQVNKATGNKYTYHKLADWCINNQVFPKQINPNAWDNCVYVYPYKAWFDVFNLDLVNLFKE